MLPQQPTGLVFVLLGDHLPALIAEQCHKQPTRRIPHPPRMHRGSHHVELGRLAAFSQPRAIACWCRASRRATSLRSARITSRRVGGGSRVGIRVQAGRGVRGALGAYGCWGAWRWRSPWLGRCDGCLGGRRVLAWSAQSPPGCVRPLDGRAALPPARPDGSETPGRSPGRPAGLSHAAYSSSVTSVSAEEEQAWLDAVSPPVPPAAYPQPVRVRWVLGQIPPPGRVEERRTPEKYHKSLCFHHFETRSALPGVTSFDTQPPPGVTSSDRTHQRAPPATQRRAARAVACSWPPVVASPRLITV